MSRELRRRTLLGSGALGGLALVAAPAAARAGIPDRRHHPDLPLYLAGTNAGTIDAPVLTECSGLAASHRNPGLFYAHNDSGGAPEVYVLDGTGRLTTTLRLVGATAIDWEDIAVGAGPGGVPYLYVGDIGDNDSSRGSTTGRARDRICVYRLPERSLAGAGPTVDVTDWEKIELAYPEGPHNCEAMLVDPHSGDLVLVVKDGLDADVTYSRVYLATPAVLAAAVRRRRPAPLLRVASIRTNVNSTKDVLATGADVSADGRLVVVKNTQEGFLWVKDPRESLARCFARAPQAPGYLPFAVAPPGGGLPGEGEAITFATDGGALFTTTEGQREPLWRFALAARPAAPTATTATPGAKKGVVTVCWRPPADALSIVEYRVYDDGRLVGWTRGVHTDPCYVGHVDMPGAATVLTPRLQIESSYLINGGVDGTRAHPYTVRAVDRLGRESAPSPPAVYGPTG